MTLVTKVRHLRGFKFKSGQKSTLKFLKLRPVFANITICFHKLHISATVSGSTVCAHVFVSHMYYVYLSFFIFNSDWWNCKTLERCFSRPDIITDSSAPWPAPPGQCLFLTPWKAHVRARGRDNKGEGQSEWERASERVREKSRKIMLMIFHWLHYLCGQHAHVRRRSWSFWGHEPEAVHVVSRRRHWLEVTVWVNGEQASAYMCVSWVPTFSTESPPIKNRFWFKIATRKPTSSPLLLAPKSCTKCCWITKGVHIAWKRAAEKDSKRCMCVCVCENKNPREN